jgi:hypothetical protein
MFHKHKINHSQLSLEQIHEKIIDDTFARLIVFPENPNLNLCLEYGLTLVKTALSVFPQIHKNRPYPDTFAILMVLLLYSTNIDLYNQCKTLNDIMDQLQFNPDLIKYEINFELIRLEDQIEKKRNCSCGHWIRDVYMCNANSNFFILGSECVHKTEIKSLIEQLEILEKRTCEMCGNFRKPANKNINICKLCSKKIYCSRCKAHKTPSKTNAEHCTICVKLIQQEQKREQERERDRERERERERERKRERKRERNRERIKLLIIEREKNIKRIKCETCPEIMIDPPYWKKICLSCYKQNQIYIEERQKINGIKKQQALQLQKELSDLNK